MLCTHSIRLRVWVYRWKRKNALEKKKNKSLNILQAGHGPEACHCPAHTASHLQPFSADRRRGMS